METINSRIAAVVKKTGLTKTAFAKALNLSQPFVSNICSGASSPSDRTISDICKIFDINETWLRTGLGEMTASHSRDEEISELISQALHGESDSFKRRLISVLCRLSEAEWELLEDMINKITKAKIANSIEENGNGQMEIKGIFDQLSPAGQERLIFHAEMIAEKETEKALRKYAPHDQAV